MEIDNTSADLPELRRWLEEIVAEMGDELGPGEMICNFYVGDFDA